MAEMASQPKSIGRYDVKSDLGAGGFATVHRCYDNALASDVAIKLLLPHIAADTDLRRRFVREAQLLRKVDSPHLIQVFDIGELDDGRPYFVMELVSGGALHDRITASDGYLIDRPSLERIITALTEGLSALHRNGVVHRDIKPDNLLIMNTAGDGTSARAGVLAETERIVIGDLGLAKDQHQTSAGPTISGGTMFYSAPEQLIAGGPPITASADVFGASAVLWHALTGAPPPQVDEIGLHLAQLAGPWQSVLATGLAREPQSRHRSIELWGEAALVALNEVGDEAVTVDLGETAALCPYKGMAAFQPADAGLFFGRDELVDVVVSKLNNHKTVVIGGPSGSGKSSLLRAGLLPRLARGALPGSQSWEVLLFTPGPDAVGELLHQLNRVGAAATPTHSVTRNDLPHGARRALPDQRHLLIAIDQFEELFTLNPSRGDQELFLATLAALTASEHTGVDVALALRADFYGECATHPWLADQINSSQLLVGPMNRSELREAIELPAQRVGLFLEEGLTDAIADDVGAEAGGLPLLGHALMETWLRRSANQLTLTGYRDAGGVSGAISQRAEEVCRGLSDTEQEHTRRLLLRLVTPGEGTPDTRRRVPLDALRQTPEFMPLIDKLASARLLTVNEHSVEVAHEALLGSWPQLQTWIKDDRQGLQTRRRIETAAAEWQTQDRNDDLLYRGTALAGALEWLAENPNDIDATGGDFLVEARRVRDDELLAHEAEQAKRRSNRRRGVAALSLLTVAALVATAVAVVNLNRSRMNETEARTQQVQALAAAASANADTRPLLGLSLALESIERANPATPTARDALVDARIALAKNPWRPQAFGDAIPVGDMLSVELSVDGSTFLTGGRAGDVVGWDTRSRTEIFRFTGAHDGGVEAIRASPDGRFAVSTGRTKALLWDLEASPPTSIELLSIPASAGPIWDAAISADSQRVAFATESAGAIVVDSTTMEQLGATLVADGVDTLSIAFLDDDTLVTGDGWGMLRTIDVASGTQIGNGVAASDGSNDIWELFVHPNGEILVTASSDNTIRSFSVADRTLSPEASFDGVVKPAGLAFSHDNAELLSGSNDGRLVRLDYRTGELLDGPGVDAHTGDRVIDGTASANGWYVSLGADQRAQVWQILGLSADLAHVVVPEPAENTSLSLSPAETYAAVGSTSRILLYAIDAEQRLTLLTELPRPATAVEFLDDQRLVSAASNGTLTLWDITDPTTPQITVERTAHISTVRNLAVSSDGSTMMSGDDDGTLISWSSANLGEQARPKPHQGEVSGVVFVPDSNEFASIGFDKQLRLSSLDGSQRQVSVEGELSIAAHPTKPLLAIGGGAEQITIIDLDGQPVTTMAPHDGGVWDVAFAPDGLSIIGTARKDGTLQMWDWESGDRLGDTLSPFAEEGVNESVVRFARSGAFWTTAKNGRVFRIDALNVSVGCELSSGVMSVGMRGRFMDDDRPACG